MQQEATGYLEKKKVAFLLVKLEFCLLEMDMAVCE